MGYTTIDILRAEGLDETEIDDATLQARIDYACARIDNFTGRFFEPRDQIFQIDGTGSRTLPLNDPIISINNVVITIGHPDSPLLTTPVGDDDLVIYNRHLTQGLTNPDDRDNPRIEIEWIQNFRYGPFSVFPDARQNVRIDGTFGYTDPTKGTAVSASELFVLADGMTLEIAIDGGATQTITFLTGNFADITQATALEVAAVIRAGLVGATVSVYGGDKVRIQSRTLGSTSSVEIVGGTAAPVLLFPPGVQSDPEGVTPPLIVRAATLMVIYDAAGLATSEHEDAANAHRVISMRTRDQQVSFRTGSTDSANSHQDVGAFTGIPEIDNILAMYMRPQDLGFVGGKDLSPEDRWTGDDDAYGMRIYW